MLELYFDINRITQLDLFEDVFLIEHSNEFQKQNNDFRKRVEIYIGKENFEEIDSALYLSKAITELNLSLSTYKTEDAFKELVRDIYFLNDDYNDKEDHFEIAIERLNINMGRLELEKSNLESIKDIYTTFKSDKFVTENFL